MRHLSLITVTSASLNVVAPLLLLSCASSAQAINVALPDEFIQCEPAQINLTQTRGNVTILIRRSGTRVVDTNVTLPVNATSWTWPAVDFPAKSNFTILVTDLSPHRKTSDTRVLSRSTVDPSPTNNDTCLPRQNGKKGSGGQTGHEGGGGLDSGDSDGFFGPHAANRRKNNTVEVAVIAGVLGGLMFVLLALTLFMCFRRRFEMRGSHEDSDDAQRFHMAARRLRDDDGVYDSRQVVTLFGHDGQPEGQAVLGRQGDAGWMYMSRMVPGLESSSPVAIQRHSIAARRRSASGRRRLITQTATARYDDEQKDIELPSYGMSEYERKNLPKYNDDASAHHAIADATASRGSDGEQGGSHPILVTRRDSRGSRLTFSSHAVRASSRVQSHIVSTPRASVAPYYNQRFDSQTARARVSGVQDDFGEDVIVFGAAAPPDASLGDTDGGADHVEGYGSDVLREELDARHDDENEADQHQRTLL